MDLHVLEVVAHNSPGVLLRVSNLFSRRYFNIVSIVTATTELEDICRMTIVAKGEKNQLRQIKTQLNKLIEVIAVNVIDSTTSIVREMCYVKLERTIENSTHIIGLAQCLASPVLHVDEKTIVLEKTGSTHEINSFLAALNVFTVLEINRIGPMAMQTTSDENAD